MPELIKNNIPHLVCECCGAKKLFLKKYYKAFTHLYCGNCGKETELGLAELDDNEILNNPEFDDFLGIITERVKEGKYSQTEIRIAKDCYWFFTKEIRTLNYLNDCYYAFLLFKKMRNSPLHCQHPTLAVVEENSLQLINFAESNPLQPSITKYTNHTL